MTKDIVKKIQDEIEENLKDDLKLCEAEQNPVEKTRILHKMEIQMMRDMLRHLTTVTDDEFLKIYEKIAEPGEKQVRELLETEKNLAYENSENAKQFEQFKEIQNLEIGRNNDFIDLLNENDFDKKSLERLLIFYITVLGQAVTEQRITNTLLHPLIDSTLLVNRLFGFDINWLMGMSLIQLHENMIKSKYHELGGEIKENQSLKNIISHLIGLVKYNEDRDITLAIDMSQGLKQIRNRMTHEGFKYSVTRDDLKKLLKEIKELEVVLFPENK